MPTIVVETTARDTGLERGFARAVSQWLRHEGVDLNHVITKFLPADPARVYSGPFLLAGPAGDARPFAFVRCTVGRDRTDAFRRGLAAEIVRALAPAIPPALVFIQFEPVDPQLHFIGSDAERRTGDVH
ncbi:hypothetical protein [Streptomyces sp. NPDC019224]|uniref:tautomerase family protein n=1 Tax=Streptomyces sp. NPDC019224 TaxID=3154484 RepID=UPI0033D6E8ED